MADASLRERKKQKTREALEEAAVRLFLEKGYSGTSIEDIASAAEVSRRTFFRYFGSKEGVIFFDADQQGEAMVQALLAQPRDIPPLIAYRDAIVALSREVASDQEAILAKQQVVMNTLELRTRASEIARRWRLRFAHTLAVRAGRSEPNETDGIVAGVAIAVLTAAIEDWVAAGGRDDLIERLKRAFDVVCEDPAD